MALYKFVSAYGLSVAALAVAVIGAEAATSSARPPGQDPIMVPVDQIVRAQDYDRAAAMLRKMAEQGNAEAQHRLAALYRIGRGVPQDDVSAFKWMKAAAEQGHITAQFDLAMMYLAGHGTKLDVASAKR